MKTHVKREELIYAKECYELINVLFEVFKNLGSGYQEKYYQKAVAKELGLRHIPFTEQVSIPLSYKGEKVGLYYLDFLVEIGGVKIVIELKKDDYFSKHHIDQVVGYLKATGLQLGILANFTPQGVKYKRIVNII